MKKIQQGKLQPLLETYAGHTRPFSLLYAQHKHMSSATRAFIDFYVQLIVNILKNMK